MGGFASLLKTKRGAPDRIVELPVKAFIEQYRPPNPVPIGLCLLSESQAQHCTSFAANMLEQERLEGELAVDFFNAQLMAQAIALAARRPDDTERHYFEGPLLVRTMLTPEGMRLLYDMLDALHKACSPTLPVLEGDGVQHLAAMLQRGGAWQVATRAERLELGRLLEYCRRQLDELEQRGEALGELVVGSPLDTGAKQSERQVVRAKA